jgi:hypothetical protein
MVVMPVVDNCPRECGNTSQRVPAVFSLGEHTPNCTQIIATGESMALCPGLGEIRPPRGQGEGAPRDFFS